MNAPLHSDLIFDVGLHKGEDSDFYLRKGFRVVAVEAQPALCDAARARLREFADAGVLTIVNGAISESAGPVAFYVNEDKSEWGTASPEWNSRNEMLGTRSMRIDVPGLEFRTLIERYGVPYYLKIDIEGADLLCLLGLAQTSARPKYVSIESEKRRWSRLRREFKLLRDLGYDRFKVVQQSDVVRQHCPKPAREGRYVDHRFEFGSSGMFGEEAPGPWLTEREALRKYRVIFVRYWLFGDYGVFRDRPRVRRFVQRIPVLRRLAPDEVGWFDTHARLELESDESH